MHSPCQDNQYCLNTRASYICQCKAGYRDNGDGTCVDINECLQGMCGGKRRLLLRVPINDAKIYYKQLQKSNTMLP